jgi:5'-methylthioadenosine phosphorylase
MHYAGLCVVTNPAAGIASYRLTSEEVIQMMKQKEQQIKEIVLSLIENYDNLSWDCQCEESLSGAIV